MEEIARKTAIVIPCHSYPKLLSEAFASIMEQTVLPELVFMVLDHLDPEYVTEPFISLTDDKPSLYILPNEQAPGVSATRNMGFEAVTWTDCQWVVPLDEDDLLETKEQGFLYRICQSIEANPWVDIHYTDWVEFGDREDHHLTPEYDYDRLLAAPFITCTAAIRLSTWLAVKGKNGQGYDENLHELGLRWEDYLFYLEAGAMGAKFARVGMPLVKARRHGRTGTDLANETIPQWREYASKKLKDLYGVDTKWPTSPSQT
jgi:glycosyltransferase involved in cell wall biosynthesis